MTDSAVPLLGRDPKESKAFVQTKMCTQMFIAALLTVTKRGKPPKCSSTDEKVHKSGISVQWNIIQP